MDLNHNKVEHVALASGLRFARGSEGAIWTPKGRWILASVLRATGKNGSEPNKHVMWDLGLRPEHWKGLWRSCEGPKRLLDSRVGNGVQLGKWI